MILRLLELPIALAATIGSKKAAKLCKTINRHRLNVLKHNFFMYGDCDTEFDPVREEKLDIKVKIGFVLAIIIIFILYWALGRLVGLTEPILY